ncbi:NAD(P)-binding protein [Macroventuria anomochaeta]|uniref:NAD(P)-binding protein n=1 Tax=Macroventuria anomochaeta TaxID=301207 RepID=A0ACB6S7Z1_9PLEO|nr:NAD(P)-binding protein [Macroventuria anomochaeta]KAF2629474.1 NAD(P)-binding protein [Macroventuria anomochaeta]
MSQKLITVFGATGAQGSSVLRSLAANVSKPFALRGTTRNPSSDSAQRLSALGVEIVKADGWDKESIVAAFQGSWGAFVNTNSDDPVFEDPQFTKTEVDLGKLIVDAAVEAGIEVFVYSGFNSAKEITKGKVANPAFDDKHAIGEYAKSTGAFKAIVLASPGDYFENFLSQELAPVFGGFPYIPSADGTLVFRSPKWGGKEDVPFIAIADDFGDIVHGTFLDPENWNGKLVQGVSDIKSFEQAVQSFERATGKKGRFEEISRWQDFDTYGIRALETVKLMFGFCQESGGRYYGEETENHTAADLKKIAAEARGRSGHETKLLTLEEFFKSEFAGK